jgi:CrcB protein
VLTLLVALAAGLGAVARYVVDQVIEHRTRGRFPVGTVTVNLTGSLLLGIVTGLSLHHGLSQRTTLILGLGLAGGYTTFSTWAWESIVLGGVGAWRSAVLNAVGSVAAGLAVAALGLGLALV